MERIYALIYVTFLNRENKKKISLNMHITNDGNLGSEKKWWELRLRKEMMGTYTKQQLICMEPIPVCILAEVYPITRLPMKSKCSLGLSLNQFVVVGNHVLIFLLLLFLCFFFIIHAALIIESQI